MRKIGFICVAAVALEALASAPAFAQDSQQQQQQQQQLQTKRKAADPNEVVCEKQQDTGSRLTSERVCMTRSQWAEQRRLDRQEIEKAQTERPVSAPQ